MTADLKKLRRAQGCLLGQLAGDSLGSLVEFENEDEIRRQYPRGIRFLADGGTWDTLAGQPTDDSEMALMLARTLIERGTYDQDAVRNAYLYWLNSMPFDCGMTVRSGLLGSLSQTSQANGAMMRISPLGIYGANHSLEQVADWARQDAGLTHPHPVCVQANALYTMAIAHAVATGTAGMALYKKILEWSATMELDPALHDTIIAAADALPGDYLHSSGWVLIAFQNALYHLVNTPNLQQALVDTVMRGGDTDTNAAIAGALLGAIHGIDAIPTQWRLAVLNCRPESGMKGVYRPRPECFWPVDAMELAEGLVGG